MNKYECDVLSDDKIKKLAIGKLLNIKNIVGVLAIVILAVVLIGAFNNNILRPSESVLREQEVKSSLMLLIPAIIVEIIFIIVIYVKIKRYFKIINGNYKCILTTVCEKREEHSEEKFNDGTIQGHSSFYLDLNGIDKLIIVSLDEYRSLNENDKCYAIMIDNNSTNEIIPKDIILVIKANDHIGKNQVIRAIK